MKRKIKNYLVFVPAGFRLLWLLVEMLVTAGIQLLFGAWNFVLVVYTVVLLFLFTEILFDYWLFGALTAKNGLQLEYLKTSGRGMQVLGTALRGHMLEQLVAELLVVAVNCVVFRWLGGKFFLAGEEGIGCLALIVLGYLLLVVEMTISHFFDGLMVIMAVSVVAMILMMGISVLIWSYPIWMWGLILILTILAVHFSMKITMKRVKESYYDGTD